MSSKSDIKKCSATTRLGQPCRAYAIRGTELCAAHSGRAGAPAGNTNRTTHGFYSQPDDEPVTIDHIIDDLVIRHARVGRYLDGLEEAGELTAEELRSLMQLLGQNASRIGRLMRDRQKMGESLDDLFSLLGEALDEISTELNVKL